MGKELIRIATRKSELAMTQTRLVADRLVACAKALGEDVTYELVSMTTEGDRRLDKSLASFGGKGVFIKELEVALLEGRADIAVHSLKDMPAQVLPEFKLAAVLEREDPRDAFVSKGGAKGIKFMDLPAGARVGTGSIRRVVQLKALRPDLEYVPIRGNIQTRLAKLAELDGVVLAAAGLKRMGLAERVTEYFSVEQVLPASGQGILAIETLSEMRHCEERTLLRHPEERSDEGSSPELLTLLASVNHAETFGIALAEMSFLKALNAGCQFPVASHAEIVDDGRAAASHSAVLKMRGIYWQESSQKLLQACIQTEIPATAGDDWFNAQGEALANQIKVQQ
ncbi:MAG: hydroxymethylbilane synthase [Fibrobacter sp.]|nr:hydroxymethylbilane synthase [Fibrobacter sp.]